MILKAKNIEHFYGHEKILHGIDLQIEPSKITAIIGESGSGKTTLLAILSSLLQPTSGEVSYDNILQSSIQDINAFRKKNIGFVFQFHYLIEYLTLRENIALGAFDEQDITALMENLGIGHLENRYSNEVSGGERQRAAIARALVNTPSFVFADEPTGNLDTKNAIGVFELFKSFSDTTFIIATHDKKIIDYADVIIEMEDGVVKCISKK
jgi:ABC-type lipoprotein export system ATPase subunit